MSSRDIRTCLGDDTYVAAFKHPVALPIVVYLIPEAQSDEFATCDVLSWYW